jgi:hypothetical protein
MTTLESKKNRQLSFLLLIGMGISSVSSFSFQASETMQEKAKVIERKESRPFLAALAVGALSAWGFGLGALLTNHYGSMNYKLVGKLLTGFLGTAYLSGASLFKLNEIEDLAALLAYFTRISVDEYLLLDDKEQAAINFYKKASVEYRLQNPVAFSSKYFIELAYMKKLIKKIKSSWIRSVSGETIQFAEEVYEKYNRFYHENIIPFVAVLTYSDTLMELTKKYQYLYDFKSQEEEGKNSIERKYVYYFSDSVIYYVENFAGGKEKYIQELDNDIKKMVGITKNLNNNSQLSKDYKELASFLQNQVVPLFDNKEILFWV